MTDPLPTCRCGVCRGDCPATQAERDAAAVQVARRHAGVIDEPPAPHFTSEAGTAHQGLSGDEYRRAIDGG